MVGAKISMCSWKTPTRLLDDGRGGRVVGGGGGWGRPSLRGSCQDRGLCAGMYAIQLRGSYIRSP